MRGRLECDAAHLQTQLADVVLGLCAHSSASH
jgi:hypothetical protein